jgi:hypothetical protein
MQCTRKPETLIDLHVDPAGEVCTRNKPPDRTSWCSMSSPARRYSLKMAFTVYFGKTGLHRCMLHCCITLSVLDCLRACCVFSGAHRLPHCFDLSCQRAICGRYSHPKLYLLDLLRYSAVCGSNLDFGSRCCRGVGAYFVGAL